MYYQVEFDDTESLTHPSLGQSIRMVSMNGATNGTAFDFSAKNLPKQLFINNEYVASKGSNTLSV